MAEHETINEALTAVVKALGGGKQVAHQLWPEKTVDSAHRHLLACLNEDKAERLSPEQLVLLMRMAHDKGCHDVMQHLAGTVGYADPVPTDHRDEMAELLRQSNALRSELLLISARMEQMMPHLLRAVA